MRGGQKDMFTLFYERMEELLMHREQHNKQQQATP